MKSATRGARRARGRVVAGRAADTPRPFALIARISFLEESIRPIKSKRLASPLEHKQRGPYGCFQARNPEKTKDFYDKLRKENVITSLREEKIRVSPYMYNNERDIDRLIAVVTV